MLATPGEWHTKTARNVTGNILASVITQGQHALLHIAAPGVVVDFDRAEALLPLINDALPDDHPNKITSLDVAAITNVAQGYRDPEYVEAAHRAASKLAAMLRSASP